MNVRGFTEDTRRDYIRCVKAHCLQAWIYASRVSLGTIDHQRGISDGLTLAKQAIELDPEDPWAHLAAGHLFTFARRTGPAGLE